MGCNAARVDEAFFRAAYDSDERNKAKQSWTDYWSWVKRFYDGQRFPPVQGWAKREEELARQHAARLDVKHALHETGALLASEWAKDNSARRVSTSDLQAWGKRFGDVAKDAENLVAALVDVRREVEERKAK